MPSFTKLKIESPNSRQTLLLSASETRLRLSDLLRRHHLPLNTRCGQRGLCDGCIVDLVAGRLLHFSMGQTIEPQIQPISVRGCEYRFAEGIASIRIPPRAMLAHEPQVVSDFKINVPRAHDPLWQQVEMARTESVAELCNVITKRRPVSSDRSAIALPQSERFVASLDYRGDHWQLTDVTSQPTSLNLGAVIDVGTTTVALLLVDLSNGETVGTASDFNHQMHFGDDVLTRINLCATDSTMVRQLQEAIVNRTIAPLLMEALKQAGADDSAVRCITVAGNTTMLHLVSGTDPTPMGFAPFTPVFLEHRVLNSEFLFQTPSASVRPSIHLLPGSAAYIGADLTAGIFSSGLVYDEGPSLLVDAGTNGEIILKHGEHFFGCATAAGPAFEGAGLTNGIRACDGAISHLRFTREPFVLHTEVIGNTKPIGICGSAYVDFLAEGRRSGILNEMGRIANAAPIRIEHDGCMALRIARSLGNRDIVISEVDIARLLQAKAAIAAGILTLLSRARLRPDDIKTLYLAGGFGLHMNIVNAIRCGLLPKFHSDQVQLVGNASLAGAYLALLDCGALDEMTRISRKIEMVELNLDPGFESRYIDQLMIPS